jgi:hypothetical protein
VVNRFLVVYRAYRGSYIVLWMITNNDRRLMIGYGEAVIDPDDVPKSAQCFSAPVGTGLVYPAVDLLEMHLLFSRCVKTIDFNYVYYVCSHTYE